MRQTLINFKRVKYTMLLLLAFFISSKFQAQEKELLITYNYSIVDMKPIELSFEVTATKKNAISLLKIKLKRGPSMPAEIESPNIPDIVVFKDYNNNYLVGQETISGKDFYTKEPLNQMQWQLTSNTKTVLKYNCQEATTTFRGRDYIAYFTTEIPFKAAPFKFYGLPGVVLQIQTTDKQINIEASTLKVQAVTKALTNPFEDKKTMSWEKFTALYKKRNKAENDKRKADIKIHSKKLLSNGAMDKSILDAQMNLTVAEPRLEIIIPENDILYLKKQMEKAFKKVKK